MLKKVADSRIAMAFIIMAVFFVLFCISPAFVVFLLWSGALAELANGLYIGARSTLSIAYTVFLSIFITFSSYCLYSFILLDFWQCYVLVQFVATSDTAQYFVGKNFGSIRPFRYSPKKSVEGYVGGLFFAFLALRISCPSIDIVTCIILTFSGMVGDMLASVWKRLIGIKDASAVFRSHGGFLDRFDSHSCTFIVASYIYGLETVLPYEQSTMLYPLYCWVIFIFGYFGVKFLSKKKPSNKA